jgi:hypothetical protein
MDAAQVDSEVHAAVEAQVEIEADRGRQRMDAATERLCIATRELWPVSHMIRFVAGPDGAVVPDLKRKLPGRGVWVTARRDIVAQAVRRGAFGRALKGNFKAPADLPDLLDRLLESAALDALSMARKAGLVITGFAKVEALHAAPVALLRARDAGAESGRKLAAALRRGGQGGEGNQTEIIETFTSAQLDLALGRLNVVHAALMAGRPSKTFLGRWWILEFFRADAPGRPRKSTNENAPMTMLQNQDPND